MNEIEVFKNEEFGQIRTAEKKGEPLICLADVCKVLEIGNPSDVRKRLSDGVDTIEVIDSLGRTQQTTFISEPNFYKVVMQSRKEKAEPFVEWVSREILPSIRKHGAYMTAPTIDAIISDPMFGIRLLTELKEERDKRKELEAELERSKEWYSIKRVAALNGVDWRVFKWRALKKESEKRGLGIKKIFDANYGEVNTYHESVWEKVYPWAEL